MKTYYLIVVPTATSKMVVLPKSFQVASNDEAKTTARSIKEKIPVLKDARLFTEVE